MVSACADLSEHPTGDGGLDDLERPAPCTATQTRCEGDSYQICSGGTFVEALRCDASRVCVEKLGCVDCNPVRDRACKGNTVHRCTEDGRFGEELEQCLGLPCALGACREPGCALGSRLVYVVDTDYRLLSFDPSVESVGHDHFKLIANLSCPDTGSATPFSMSVDRGARAWVLYTNGEIYWVDTKTGSCSASPFVRGQSGYELFGMGFVSDEPGSSKERLYIAGAMASRPMGNESLGYIDPATMKITVVGEVAQAEYSPELTGTGNAELFAYHPGFSDSFVAKMDKKSSKVMKKWSVTPLGAQVTAWAFSHWGGRFYIFVTSSEDGFSETSRVLQLDPQTGKSTVFLPSIPYKIVGAGVSTCAPVID
jgi:hypothetical protein